MGLLDRIPANVLLSQPCKVEGLHLTEQEGKAVQEILNRYISDLWEHRRAAEFDEEWVREYDKDINYIEGLTKLFD